MPLPPDVVITPTPTRGSEGDARRAPVAINAPASRRWSIVATLATPTRVSAASTTSSPEVSAPVCDAAARAPASLLPAFTATVGTAADALARAAKSVTDSRYNKRPETWSSYASAAATSSAVTSASLPVVTAMPTGSSRSSPNDSAPNPSAPDWLTSAREPAGSGVLSEENTGLNVAMTASAPPTEPMQLGPSKRM